MEIHFNPELRARIDEAAIEAQSSGDEYVQRSVEIYIDHDAWSRAKVTASLQKLDHGEFIGHAEVGERLSELLRRT
jgi:predicted transcriptional regulator